MKELFSVRPMVLLTVMFLLTARVSAQVNAPEPAAPPADALPGHIAEERHSSTYEVTAIDAATRMITLREVGKAGEAAEEPQVYSVDKEVRNLDLVKVGDRVKVDTYAATTIKVLPPGELVNEEVATIDRAKPGEKPGGTATRTRMITATVSSVFPESKEFLTRNAKGQLRTWKVPDAKDLEKLQSGDRVQLTYTSALAVSVTPAPPIAPATAAAAKEPPAAPAPDAAKQPAAPAPAPEQPKP